MATVWKRVRSWLSGRDAEAAAASLIGSVREAAGQFGRTNDLKSLAVGVRAAAEADHGASTVEGLALFVVAAERRLGMTAFDVQLRAAAEIVCGAAVEMQTGEGKSLTAAAAAAALALQGRHVHVVTVNRYLAERDYRRFAPVLEALGLSVGLVVDGRSPAKKARAYSCDVVFAAGYELGFDYLRGQLRRLRRGAQRLSARLQSAALSPDEPVFDQRLDFAVIDELDSVLLDEACVPLILSEASGVVSESDVAYALARDAAARLEPDADFTVHALQRLIALTPAGLARADAAFPKQRAVRLLRPWRSYVQSALVASILLRRDVDYVVADGRIWLVDVTTGRIFGDRRWPEGLHQAVEFKEGLPFSPPTVGAARITRQRFFGLYRSLSGMSGTLVEAADELRRSYRLDVRSIAPRLASRRAEWPTQFFVTDAQRLDAVVAEAAEQHALGRPILVGCRTIQAGGAVAARFEAAGLTVQLLNGLQTESEAELIAAAGHARQITVATNLAGRGTDIVPDDEALRAGGLHVIGVERHDSPRIDRQLLGRAGRQGNPGSGRFFVSAADAILASFPAAADVIRRRCGDRPAADTALDAALRRCQVALENQGRLRRRETSTVDDRLDELLALLARSE